MSTPKVPKYTVIVQNSLTHSKEDAYNMTEVKQIVSERVTIAKAQNRKDVTITIQFN